jgi:hypothetical protein
MARTRLDDEVLELLADDPDLRAIADAFAETQTRHRRVRPVGVLVAVALAAAVVLAFAFWSGGGSSGISGNTAYAAIGGASRLVQVDVVSSGSHVSLQYDRVHEQLTVSGHGATTRLAAGALPPGSRGLAPALLRGFGAGIGPAVSLLIEYPPLAKAGNLQDVARPPTGEGALRWVSYRSALGYVVEVGLRPGVLKPLIVLRAGSDTPVTVNGFAAMG